MTNISVKQAISYIKQEIDPLYPAQEVEALTSIVLQHTLKLSRAAIYLNTETNLSKTVFEDIKKITEALKKFEPLQYILGETWFYGLKFEVNKHVLIPRPETEELVHWILTENGSPPIKVVDLGTGSGCIAVSLAKERAEWNLTAVDISREALDVAHKNALGNKVDIQFTRESILDPSANFLSGKYNIIVSNPPYVSPDQKEEMLPNVLEHEPHLALFAPGNDPLLFYRRIAHMAATMLEPGGMVYLELNEALPVETAEIFQSSGFKTELRKDINEKFRMLKAYRND